jgi:hypothetical protein
MSRLLAFALCAGLVAAASPAAAWGPIGHRVSAELAERNISGRTRAQVEEILGSERLAEAATWPDEQRSNPDAFWRETASPFHYVTLPPGQRADQLAHPPEGDAASALERFTAVLRDPAASRDDKARALRFVVHIVADLHMPLHAGKPGDRGGNDVKVLWFDAPQNLHWVWDEGILNRQQLSFSEYADRLEARTTPEQVIAWWDPRPATWIDESTALRDRVYPATGGNFGLGTAASPVVLSWDYEWQWRPSLEQRLQQGGVRLAAYLDWVFANNQVR